MRVEPVSRWIICFAGFGQNAGRLTGIERLQDALRREYADDDTVVLLKSWDDNAEHLVERICNRRPKEKPPEVVVIGYSLGGWKAVEFCNEAIKKDVVVESLFLCDAVWKSRFPFLLWLSYFWPLELVVNSGVKRLAIWRQIRDRPTGSAIRFSQATKLIKPTYVTRMTGHSDMDDLADFQKTVMLYAAKGEP